VDTQPTFTGRARNRALPSDSTKVAGGFGVTLADLTPPSAPPVRRSP
jgi:hypothetical protein